ncbi:DNA-binding response regulator, NarL/FixJ family, contains REC and HTH domains [Paramicrobacterium humi]|uniref:DNA-binding response regulator, NarL/FixJ family, contains REC and HTH domains n=1 Tax=Paramicrobacterium humi TaxID=640635 RepID=A0A1H4TLU2_9MICO|nr:response regulator transcription factor [Microbacterium humi]SEC57422.1 DNA-binding response regulator, NarL/FixJ family, contains REC and HTH domains [Microbacterium humi]
MTTVVIADDQELVRTGFRLILDLEPDLSVVGEAADGAACVELVARTHPDVVLMDVRMPSVDGLEATRRLQAANSPARILVLTTFDLDKYVYEALRAGASGFLLKDAPREQLIAAIRTVVSGNAPLAPSVTRRLIERFVRTPAPDADLVARLESLSAREREVLRLLSTGLSNAEIASRLFVGDATVKTHVARLLTKLGARDRVQAIVLAYESGFVRPGRASETRDEA